MNGLARNLTRIYTTRQVTINVTKLHELDILWGSTAMGIVMSVADWRRAERAGAVLVNGGSS